LGDKILPTVVTTWKIMPCATQVFDGCVIQNILGKLFLTILYKDDNSKCFLKHIPELDKFKIINAKYEKHICVLIGFYQGSWYRIILKLDERFNDYSYQEFQHVGNDDINITVLDTGVVVNLVNDTLELFLTDIKNKSLKQIFDSGIDSRVKLCSEGKKVLFSYDDKIYHMTIS
jgi:hypothetical protein